MDYVDHNYQLSQKNKIAFGIIAREKRIAATDLSKILQLSAEERLRSYIDNLDKSNLITKGGVKKGSFFQINTTLLKNAKSNIVTSLKTEPTLKSKACLKCLYFTKIISALCCYLEYFSYLYTIN